MNDNLSLTAFGRQLLRDFRQTWQELLLFDVAFQMLRAWLMLPLVGLILAYILLRAGYLAVNNEDIVRFLLSPLGGIYVALLGATSAIFLLLEQAGMLFLAAKALKPQGGSQETIRQRGRTALAAMTRVAKLGVFKICLLLLAFSPFVALALLSYFLLLTTYDIYYYLNAQPPAFWLAAVIGLVLLLAMSVLGAWLLVGWSLALPIVVFESQTARGALAASRQRVRGSAWPAAKLFLGWILGSSLIGAVIATGLRAGATLLISQGSGDSLMLLGTMLAVQATMVAAFSFLFAAGLALITLRLYWLRTPQAETASEPLAPSSSKLIVTENSRPRVAGWLAAAVLIFGPLTFWGILTEKVVHRPKVLVTAHRGFAKRAPENTAAALREAIKIGADYAEIDVHQTSDGVVVLLHDRDFRRVAGDSRRLDQTTLAEVRKLDVGSWFSEAFAGERIPTLEEAVELCRGKIRLNIEIKVFGPADALAQRVAEIVGEQDFAEDCIITSSSHEALLAVRKRDPELLVGIIVGTSIGNINLLDVDALSVRAEHLSDTMIRTAHHDGRQVMVWGMNGEPQIRRQLSRGVDNLITSDPELALHLRDEWQDATDHERLVMAAKMLLGVGPR